MTVSTMKILVSFRQDFGRAGALDGLFVTTREQLENAYGKTAYFGEALGKHSEVWCELEEGQFTILTEDQDFISKLQHYVGEDISGWNPLDYVGDEDEDEE